MADMLDYIEWRGDLTFREREFNDVDNLILSLLAYSDFKGIISMDEGSPPISIADLYSKYTEAGKIRSLYLKNARRRTGSAISWSRITSI